MISAGAPGRSAGAMSPFPRSMSPTPAARPSGHHASISSIETRRCSACCIPATMRRSPHTSTPTHCFGRAGVSMRRSGASRRARRRRAAAHVLLVTHDQGGGTERVVASRVAALLACGFAPLLLRGRDGLTHLALPEGGPPTPNLRFDLPGELAAMVRLLAPWRPAAIEMHHRLGHHTSIRDLPGRLGVPTSWWVHDHAWLCPRVTLTAGDGRYCGEPPPNACNRCIDAWGRLDEETIDPAGLRMRSADDFGRASSLIVPSADVAARLRRHIPSARPDIRPWAVEPPFALAPAGPRDGPHRVAVIGAIGVQKGF